VDTSQYHSWVLFLPLALYQQFRRAANAYFLIIACVQLSTDLSPTNRFSTLLPLCVVLAVSCGKEAVEDARRRAADAAVNGSWTSVLAPPLADGGAARWAPTQWRELQVGDVVRLAADEAVPADLVLLATATPHPQAPARVTGDPPMRDSVVPGTNSTHVPPAGSISESQSASAAGGTAFVETASLDGETNLKQKRSLAATQGAGSDPIALAHVSGSLMCEAPNARLHSFEGALALASAHADLHAADPPGAGAGIAQSAISPPAGKQYAMSTDNVLLRGTTLRNTAWAVGLVVYTGHDTKLLRNAGGAPSKRSRVDVLVDRVVGGMLAALVALCAAVAVGSAVWTAAHARGAWYLPFLQLAAGAPQSTANATALLTGGAASGAAPVVAVASVLQTWVTALLLFNNLVPISLYVTLELVKVAQAAAIEADPQLVYRCPAGQPPDAAGCSGGGDGPAVAVPARARTSNLNENLGQIEVLFTDKTGTLTANDMVLRCLSVGTRRYGRAPPPGGGSEDDDVSVATGSASPVQLHRDDVPRPSVRLPHQSAGAAPGSSGPAVAPLDARLSAVLGDCADPGHWQAVEFLTCMVLCHSVQVGSAAVIPPRGAALRDVPRSQVQPVRLADTSGAEVEDGTGLTPAMPAASGRLEAASPDELALVTAAAGMGFELVARDELSVTVRVLGHLQRYELLAVNAFTSERKRMSVLVRPMGCGLSGCGTCARLTAVSGILPGEATLYVKGADAAVIPLVTEPAPAPPSVASISRPGDPTLATHDSATWALSLQGLSEHPVPVLRSEVRAEPEPEPEPELIRFSSSQPSGGHGLELLAGAASIGTRAYAHHEFEGQVRERDGEPSTMDTAVHHYNVLAGAMTGAMALGRMGSHTRPRLSSAHDDLAQAFANELHRARPADVTAIHVARPRSESVSITGAGGAQPAWGAAPSLAPTPVPRAWPDAAESATEWTPAMSAAGSSPYHVHEGVGGSAYGSPSAVAAGSWAAVQDAAAADAAAGMSEASFSALSALQEHLDTFAGGGLRTLVMARRPVAAGDAAAMAASWAVASLRVSQRDAALDAVAQNMELGLQLLGAAGIEDRLQEGVPDTVAALGAAGIKVIMCTGDKTETAVNIALAARLLRDDMELLVLRSTDAAANMASLAAVRASLQERGLWRSGVVNRRLGLVLEGAALQQLLPLAGSGGHAALAGKGRTNDGMVNTGGRFATGWQRLNRSVTQLAACLMPTELTAWAVRRWRWRTQAASGRAGPRQGGLGHSSSDLPRRLRGYGSSAVAPESAASPARVHAGGELGAGFAPSSEATRGRSGARISHSDADCGGSITDFHSAQPSSSGRAPRRGSVLEVVSAAVGRRRRGRRDSLGGPPDAATVLGAPEALASKFGGGGSDGQEQDRNAGGGDDAMSVDDADRRGSRHDDRTAAVQLLDFVRQSAAVVACRLTPLQKAQLVRLVQRGVRPAPLCAAVGDGGNDVSMIQAADVGIGIHGREGTQAVRAADFAVGRFHLLARLLLVHGRADYKRVCTVVLFCLYKNCALITALALFTFYNGFSGTALFESYLGAAWNILFTSVPVLVVGVADADLSPAAAMAYPLVYRSGQRNAGFSAGRIVQWLAAGVWHSFVVCAVVATAFVGSVTDGRDGRDAGLWLNGSALNGALVCLVTAKLALGVRVWSRLLAAAVAGSLSVWLLFVAVYSLLYGATSARVAALADMAGVGGELLGRPAFWLVVPASVGAALLPDLLLALMRRHLAPSLVHLIQEWEAGHGKPLSHAQLVALSDAGRPPLGGASSPGGRPELWAPPGESRYYSRAGTAVFMTDDGLRSPQAGLADELGAGASAHAAGRGIAGPLPVSPAARPRAVSGLGVAAAGTLAGSATHNLVSANPLADRHANGGSGDAGGGTLATGNARYSHRHAETAAAVLSRQVAGVHPASLLDSDGGVIGTSDAGCSHGHCGVPMRHEYSLSAPTAGTTAGDSAAGAPVVEAGLGPLHHPAVMALRVRAPGRPPHGFGRTVVQFETGSGAGSASPGIGAGVFTPGGSSAASSTFAGRSRRTPGALMGMRATVHDSDQLAAAYGLRPSRGAGGSGVYREFGRLPAAAPGGSGSGAFVRQRAANPSPQRSPATAAAAPRPVSSVAAPGLIDPASGATRDAWLLTGVATAAASGVAPGSGNGAIGQPILQRTIGAPVLVAPLIGDAEHRHQLHALVALTREVRRQIRRQHLLVHQRRAREAREARRHGAISSGGGGPGPARSLSRRDTSDGRGHAVSDSASAAGGAGPGAYEPWPHPPAVVRTGPGNGLAESLPVPPANVSHEPPMPRAVRPGPPAMIIPQPHALADVTAQHAAISPLAAELHTGAQSGSSAGTPQAASGTHRPQRRKRLSRTFRAWVGGLLGRTAAASSNIASSGSSAESPRGDTTEGRGGVAANTAATNPRAARGASANSKRAERGSEPPSPSSVGGNGHGGHHGSRRSPRASASLSTPRAAVRAGSGERSPIPASTAGQRARAGTGRHASFQPGADFRSVSVDEPAAAATQWNELEAGARQGTADAGSALASARGATSRLATGNGPGAGAPPVGSAFSPAISSSHSEASVRQETTSGPTGRAARSTVTVRAGEPSEGARRSGRSGPTTWTSSHVLPASGAAPGGMHELPSPPRRKMEHTEYAHPDSRQQRGAARQIPFNRCTHRFDGDPGQEGHFMTHFFVKKSARLTRAGLGAALLLSIVYVGLEAMSSPSTATIAVRAAVIAAGALFLLWTCLPAFRRHYSISLCLALTAVGVTKTALIDAGGVYGQALFQLGVMLVLRLRFVHALAVCGVDLLVYVVYTAAAGQGGGAQAHGAAAAALPQSLVYLAFVAGFSAYGSWALHCAMREDYLQEGFLFAAERRGAEMIGDMLPRHVVERLRDPRGGGGLRADWGGAVSDAEPAVSVLFVDIIAFQAVVASHTPPQLLALLDSLYSLFDALAEKHGVWKLETVGREWVGVAGLQGAPRDHAGAVARMALDVQRLMTMFRARDGRQALCVRCGINSGPALAGIVGGKRPQFVLCGDTVNTASRMQSSGVDNGIQISEASHALLTDRFACQPRTVDVKSKGRMRCWLLLGLGKPLPVPVPVALAVAVTAIQGGVANRSSSGTAARERLVETKAPGPSRPHRMSRSKSTQQPAGAPAGNYAVDASIRSHRSDRRYDPPPGQGETAVPSSRAGTSERASPRNQVGTAGPSAPDPQCHLLPAAGVPLPGTVQNGAPAGPWVDELASAWVAGVASTSSLPWADSRTAGPPGTLLAGAVDQSTVRTTSAPADAAVHVDSSTPSPDITPDGSPVTATTASSGTGSRVVTASGPRSSTAAAGTGMDFADCTGHGAGVGGAALDAVVPHTTSEMAVDQRNSDRRPAMARRTDTPEHVGTRGRGLAASDAPGRSAAAEPAPIAVRVPTALAARDRRAEVALHRLTYRFMRRPLEQRWQAARLRAGVPLIRRVVLLLAAFHLFRLLDTLVRHGIHPDGTLALSGSLVAGGGSEPTARPGLREAVARLVFMVAALAFLALTYSQWYLTGADQFIAARLAAANASLSVGRRPSSAPVVTPQATGSSGSAGRRYSSAGGSLFVAQPLSARLPASCVAASAALALWTRRHAHGWLLLGGGAALVAAGYEAQPAVLDLIFFFSLVANGGTASLLTAAGMNTAVAVAFLAVALGSGPYKAAAAAQPVGPRDLFFLVAGLCTTLIAAASTEYYRRHRFGVASLTQDEVAANKLLLYRMLPLSVARKLLESNGHHYISQDFAGVTLLMCDIQGFTAMTAVCTPAEVIALLHALFLELDRLTDAYGVFKVCTIGDAYLAASGIPFSDLPTDYFARGSAQQRQRRVRARLGGAAAAAEGRDGAPPSAGSASGGSSIYFDRRRAAGAPGPALARHIDGNGMRYFAPAPPGAVWDRDALPASNGDTAMQDDAGAAVALSVAPLPTSPGPGGSSGGGGDLMTRASPGGPPADAHAHTNSRGGFTRWRQLLRRHGGNTAVAPGPTLAAVADDDGDDTATAGALKPPAHLYDGPPLGTPPLPHVAWAATSASAKSALPAASYNAAVMLRLSLDIVGVVARFRHPRTGERLRMRVGLHTGRVAAGVIGTRAFRFDVYGPDVLVAASMEAHGVAGGVVVSGATRDTLTALDGTSWALPGVAFLPRGPVEVNGTGAVDTFAVSADGVPGMPTE
jgi:magnesium-transporting ATPase (P-type)/class 3 adenylate cyclase